MDEIAELIEAGTVPLTTGVGWMLAVIKPLVFAEGSLDQGFLCQPVAPVAAI